MQRSGDRPEPVRIPTDYDAIVGCTLLTEVSRTWEYYRPHWDYYEIWENGELVGHGRTYNPEIRSATESWASRNHYTSRAIFTPRTNPPWTWRVQWRYEDQLTWDTEIRTIH